MSKYYCPVCGETKIFQGVGLLFEKPCHGCRHKEKVFDKDFFLDNYTSLKRNQRMSVRLYGRAV